MEGGHERVDKCGKHINEVHGARDDLRAACRVLGHECFAEARGL